MALSDPGREAEEESSLAGGWSAAPALSWHCPHCAPAVTLVHWRTMGRGCMAGRLLVTFGSGRRVREQWASRGEVACARFEEGHHSLSIEEPLEFVGLEVPVSRRCDQRMFWKGTGKMARLGQQPRREQGRRWWQCWESKSESKRRGWTLGSIELGEFAPSPQALVWPFTWVPCLPTGLGALGLVKGPKPLCSAHQKSAI